MPTVAVLGASANRSKFGNKAVRAFTEAGWTVFPINPKEISIEGIPCVATLDRLPGRVDVISAYLPPALLLPELAIAATIAIEEIWLNPGTDTPEVVAEAQRQGLVVVQDCSIVRLGKRPDQYP